MTIEYVEGHSRQRLQSYVLSPRPVHDRSEPPSVKQSLPGISNLFDVASTGQSRSNGQYPIQTTLFAATATTPALNHYASTNASVEDIGSPMEQVYEVNERSSDGFLEEDNDNPTPHAGKRSRAQSLKLDFDEEAKKKAKKEKMTKRRDEENIRDIYISILMHRERVEFAPKERLSKANRESAIGRLYNKTAIQDRIIEKLTGGQKISQDFVDEVHYEMKRLREVNEEIKRINKERKIQGQKPLSLEKLDAHGIVEDYIRWQA